MTEREAYIREWIEDISTVRPELGGFSVCPYASKANYKIIECFVADIVPVAGYDVIFYVIEDELHLEDIQYWVNFYNDIHPEYVFLEDCASYDSFIAGIQTNNGGYNLILMQNKKELRKHRAFLESLGYYKHWSDKMMREVLDEDYEMVKNRDSNPVKSSV